MRTCGMPFYSRFCSTPKFQLDLNLKAVNVPLSLFQYKHILAELHFLSACISCVLQYIHVHDNFQLWNLILSHLLVNITLATLSFICLPIHFSCTDSKYSSGMCVSLLLLLLLLLSPTRTDKNK